MVHILCLTYLQEAQNRLQVTVLTGPPMGVRRGRPANYKATVYERLSLIPKTAIGACTSESSEERGTQMQVRTNHVPTIAEEGGSVLEMYGGYRAQNEMGEKAVETTLFCSENFEILNCDPISYEWLFGF